MVVLAMFPERLSKMSTFFLLRLSSVFLVQTWFVPDEYWQSLEIAHRLSFGYGYLTWEWHEGIRSLLHPLLIAIVYKHLENFNMDSQAALIYTPRVLQAILTAWTEWCFAQALKTKLSKDQISCFFLLQMGSYFIYYVGSRTLGNTLEMNFVLLGISYYITKKKGLFLLCMLFSFYLRPTCASLWFPFAIQFAYLERSWLLSYSGFKILNKCAVVLSGIVCLDSWWYGKFILIPLQFLLFNFVNNYSQFYGEHVWHWYFTNALPSLMGVTLLPIIMSVAFLKRQPRKTRELSYFLLLSSGSYIIFHSLVGHKEIRFLTPVIPLLNVLASLSLANLSRRWKKLFTIVFCLSNIPAIWYLSLRHQRGVLDALDSLRFRITPEDSALFLMPCHSTPFYSHLHVNATLTFLACPPNLYNQEGYTDEADLFYQQPDKWLLENAQADPPNYLVFFDVLLGQLTAYLDSKNYQMIGNFFHADMTQGRVGRRVFVFHRR